MTHKTSLVAVLLISFGIFMGCSSDINCGCTPPPTSVEIGLSYLDESGNDLLNSDHQHAIDKYSLDIYYLTSEGEEARLHYGSDYEIRRRENENNFVDLGLLAEVFVDVNATIIISFPVSPTDTMEVHTERTSYDRLYAQKIWYDSNLIWKKNTSGSSELKFFKFTKPIAEN